MSHRDGLPEWYSPEEDVEMAFLSLAIVTLLLIAGAWALVVGIVTMIGWIL